MLIVNFEQAFLQQNLALSAIRVSERVWQALNEAGHLMRHRSPLAKSRREKLTPQDLFFYKNVLILIDPLLNGQGNEQSFIPLSTLITEKFEATTVNTSELDQKTSSNKKSTSKKNFVDRHSNRWMGRS